MTACRGEAPCSRESDSLRMVPRRAAPGLMAQGLAAMAGALADQRGREGRHDPSTADWARSGGA